VTFHALCIHPDAAEHFAGIYLGAALIEDDVSRSTCLQVLKQKPAHSQTA
jgi:hypothetical protein